ncbi:hypothetical protein BGW80DRAFT_1155481, partial [Lactifluus volemus]
KELQAFLEREQAQARVKQSIHTSHLHASCFSCITGTPSTRFSRIEESCSANCVERLL